MVKAALFLLLSIQVKIIGFSIHCWPAPTLAFAVLAQLYGPVAKETEIGAALFTKGWKECLTYLILVTIDILVKLVCNG